MFTKRLLGVAVACAMAGAVGIASAAPTLEIRDSLGVPRTDTSDQVEHTGDAGGSIYPWAGGAGPGAGVPSSTTTPSPWPTGGGIGPDPSFPGQGTSGWHNSYLWLTEAANVTFQFMGAGNSEQVNSFWVDANGSAAPGGWTQLFADGQSSNPTHPCPVTPNGATFPSCDILSGGFPDQNQYTYSFSAGFVPFAFDLDGAGGTEPNNPAAGPINIPGQAWGNSGYPGRTGNPDTSLANTAGSPGFFLGADPYLVNANHVSTGLQAVYAGLTDLPCTTAGCDHDFQDMGVRITVETPEPGTLALLGIALSGLAVARKRRSAKA